MILRRRTRSLLWLLIPVGLGTASACTFRPRYGGPCVTVRAASTTDTATSEWIEGEYSNERVAACALREAPNVGVSDVGLFVATNATETFAGGAEIFGRRFRYRAEVCNVESAAPMALTLILVVVRDTANGIRLRARIESAHAMLDASNEWVHGGLSGRNVEVDPGEWPTTEFIRLVVSCLQES